MQIERFLNLEEHAIGAKDFRAACRDRLDNDGILVMPDFVRGDAIRAICEEARAKRAEIYSKAAEHNVYLAPRDPAFGPGHARNRLVLSSKGCLTDDAISTDSPLRAMYDAPEFREFLCAVLGEEALFEYADPLSSVNLHFAEKGQELGWHFDNSSFAITLMVQPPERGGAFEYVPEIRDADAGEMGFAAVANVLDGRGTVQSLSAQAGTLVLFRGRNSLHRVAPNEAERTRILAVLAYNAKRGVALSEKARLTFYGRTG